MTIELENSYLMNTRSLMKIVSCLTLLLLISCQGETDKSLTGFFDEVSTQMPVHHLEQFKNAEIDSAGQTVKLIYEDMLTAYNKFGSKYDLGIFADSIGREWQDTSRVIYLSVAYHLFCNNKEPTLSSIHAEVKKMSDYERLKYRLNSAKEDDVLANINSSNFKIGDTINVCLLIDNDLSAQYHHYYCAAILSDEEYFLDHHSTGLSGILLYKSQGEKNPTGRDLIFNIKVLAMGKEDVIMSYQNSTKIGDTVKLNVTSYRRLIGKGISTDCSQP